MQRRNAFLMTGEAGLLEVDVQLEFIDYVRYQYYDSLRRMWWLIALCALAGAFSVAVIVFSAVRQDSYLLRDIIPFASMILLGSVFLVATPYLTAKRESDMNPGVRQVIRYRLHETHLAIASSRVQGKVSWTKVREARETGSAFLLYVEGSSRAFILAKHEFLGADEIASLRELLTVILGAPKCRFQMGPLASRF